MAAKDDDAVDERPLLGLNPVVIAVVVGVVKERVEGWRVSASGGVSGDVSALGVETTSKSKLSTPLRRPANQVDKNGDNLVAVKGCSTPKGIVELPITLSVSQPQGHLQSQKIP